MTTITPEKINLSTLPFVSLDCRKDLPECPGIYFVVDNAGTVQYIGRSNNIRQRWSRHHRYNQLKMLESVVVAWLQVSDSLLLSSIEIALIEYFQPLLNNQVTPDKQKRTFLQIAISPEKKEKFAKKVQQKGRNITDVLTKFIDDYIEEPANKANPVQSDSMFFRLIEGFTDLRRRVEEIEKKIYNSLLVR
jgi:GIY-YIG catalytic domain